MFVSSSLCLPIIMCVDYAGTSTLGKAPGLTQPTNWKSLPGTNTVAFTKLVNYRQKSFNIGPWGKCYKLFITIIYKFLYYARVFVPGKLLQVSLIYASRSKESNLT